MTDFSNLFNFTIIILQGIGIVLILKTKQGLECKLRQIGRSIMSQISQFVEKQQAHNTKIGTGIDGIAEDIKSLNKKIEELQNSPGEITPEDQALLDALETQGDALASRITDLDNLTPPVIPPVA